MLMLLNFCFIGSIIRTIVYTKAARRPTPSSRVEYSFFTCHYVFLSLYASYNYIAFMAYASTLLVMCLEPSAGKDSPVRLFTNAASLGLPVGQLFPLPRMGPASDSTEEDEADGECYKYDCTSNATCFVVPHILYNNFLIRLPPQVLIFYCIMYCTNRFSSKSHFIIGAKYSSI